MKLIPVLIYFTISSTLLPCSVFCEQIKLSVGSTVSPYVIKTQNPDYRELARQEKQIGMFFYKRTEVIIIDDRIFKYYKIRLKNIPTEQAVTFHDVFEESSYKIAFQKQNIRDAFNQGLKDIRSSGKYNDIIKEPVLNHLPFSEHPRVEGWCASDFQMGMLFQTHS